MPSFADLKAKAMKAKDVSIEKIQQTRDRNTSTPMAKTNWNPYGGQSAPPPPPPRVNTNTKPVHSFPPPPAPNRPNVPPPPSRTGSAVRPSTSSALSPPSPVRPSPPTLPLTRTLSTAPVLKRSTRPDITPSEPEGPIEPEIDWTKLTPEDKEVFFSWLDEFFGRYHSIDIPPRSTVTYR